MNDERRGMSRDDAEIYAELDAMHERLEDPEESYEDFDDWYTQLRRQYGKPSDAAMEFLEEGDFAAFEQLMRDGYEPPLR